MSLSFLSILLPFLFFAVGFLSLYLIFGNKKCPRCVEKLPFFRTPTSTKQALWGGWTCANCGCETDKWGNEIDASTHRQKSQVLLEPSKEEFIKPYDEKGKTRVERVIEDKEQ